MAGTIAENMASVFYRIERAARKSGRDPSEITLVAATKQVDAKRLREAVKAGARVFGENYVQEAGEKIAELRKKSISWHFIGHLQKNKAKQAIELFDVIETIDSFELAGALSKRAAGKPVNVLIEVNIAGEKTKSGVGSKHVEKLVRRVAELPNLKVIGLMAVPPFHENSELSRPYFITLRRIAERLNRENIPGVSMHELSMGMSDDFEVAIEEGATIVRVGRAIFGEREKKAGKAGENTAITAQKKGPPQKTATKKPAAKKTVKKAPAKKKPAGKKTVKKASARKNPAGKKAAGTAKKATGKKATKKKK